MTALDRIILDKARTDGSYAIAYALMAAASALRALGTAPICGHFQPCVSSMASPTRTARRKPSLLSRHNSASPRERSYDLENLKLTQRAGCAHQTASRTRSNGPIETPSYAKIT